MEEAETTAGQQQGHILHSGDSSAHGPGQPHPKVPEAAISSPEGPIHVLKPAEPPSVSCCSVHVYISKVIINIQNSEQQRGNY